MSYTTHYLQNERMNKRILIDATTVNITQPGGGSFCVQAYIEALLALYPGQIDILHPQEAHIRDERYNTIDVPKRNTRQIIKGMVKGQFHRGAEYILKHIEQHPNTYHTIVINTGLFAGSLINPLKQAALRIIVLHHNYEPEYRIASRSVLTLFGHTTALVKYWEKKGYLGADINLFLTSSDCNTFECEYGKQDNNHVIGIFEPTHKKQSLAHISPSKTAVITCALGDKQNQNSLMQFIQCYMPTFSRLLPDWQVALMGRNPSEHLISIVQQTPNMTIYPNPKDIRSLAADCTIYLCPMDSGGGLKLRIMDGLRAGQPIILHERSARGYEILSNKSYFKTYNDINSFIEAIQAIHTYIASNANSRQTIQEEYYTLFGLERGINHLKEILCK
jgi:glycosyltransferase involved in cell wall biosynthesis